MKTIAINRAACQCFTLGNWSRIIVMKQAIWATFVPIPNVRSMKKNIAEKNWDTHSYKSSLSLISKLTWGHNVNLANASGYEMKAKKIRSKMNLEIQNKCQWTYPVLSLLWQQSKYLLFQSHKPNFQAFQILTIRLLTKWKCRE